MEKCNKCLWHKINKKSNKGLCLFYGLVRFGESNICIDFRNGDDDNYR